MQTNKWGPSAWNFLHSITFDYPLEPNDEDRKHYIKFFKNMKNVLPCSLCRKSFSFFIRKFTIKNYVEDREGIVYWLFILHNLINLKLGHPIFNLKDCILNYENVRARCGKINIKDKNKIYECQKTIEWNNEFEKFHDRIINKYQNITVRRVCKMLKKYKKNNLNEPNDIENIIISMKNNNNLKHECFADENNENKIIDYFFDDI